MIMLLLKQIGIFLSYSMIELMKQINNPCQIGSVTFNNRLLNDAG